MDRIKLLKQGSLAAIGLASITSKKANDLLEDLMKRGKITQKEGETIAKKMVANALREEQRIRTQILSEVAKSAKRVMAVTQEEARRLMSQAKKGQPKAKTATKKKSKKKPMKVKRKKKR